MCVCVFSHALGIGMQALMLVEQALYQLSQFCSPSWLIPGYSKCPVCIITVCHLADKVTGKESLYRVSTEENPRG